MAIGRSETAWRNTWCSRRNKPEPLVVSAFRDNPFRAASAAMGGREMKDVSHLIRTRQIVSVPYLRPVPRVLLRSRS